MKGFLLTVFFLALIPITAGAQASISGMVYDRSTDLPLAYASVTLHTGFERTMLTGALTDEDGRFIFKGITGSLTIPLCVSTVSILQIWNIM